MPARKNKPVSTPIGTPGSCGAPGAPKGKRLVLVVHPARVRREALMRLLASSGYACLGAQSASAAEEAIESRDIATVLVAESIASEIGCEPELGATRILLCEKIDIDTARRAVSLRFDDLIDERTDARSLAEALERSWRKRPDETGATAREKRLLGLCHRLNDSRKALSKELNRLCADMTRSYSDLAGKIDTVAIAGEFTGLVRQELELESLMRTSLEFLLAKLGSMNAALFLPSSTGDWSLGAYVNFDRARDSAEMMLDHLADTTPERLGELGATVRLDTETQVCEVLPGASDWLAECTVLGSPAVHEGETLACVLLFRDRSAPFPDHAKATMEAISKILASQFARVIKVHHRHLPKEQWASPGDPLPPAGGAGGAGGAGEGDGADDLDDRDLLC